VRDSSDSDSDSDREDRDNDDDDDDGIGARRNGGGHPDLDSLPKNVRSALLQVNDAVTVMLLLDTLDGAVSWKWALTTLIPSRAQQRPFLEHLFGQSSSRETHPIHEFHAIPDAEEPATHRSVTSTAVDAKADVAASESPVPAPAPGPVASAGLDISESDALDDAAFEALMLKRYGPESEIASFPASPMPTSPSPNPNPAPSPATRTIKSVTQIHEITTHHPSHSKSLTCIICFVQPR
jgi:hypothetical protein